MRVIFAVHCGGGKPQPPTANRRNQSIADDRQRWSDGQLAVGRRWNSFRFRQLLWDPNQQAMEDKLAQTVVVNRIGPRALTARPRGSAPHTTGGLGVVSHRPARSPGSEFAGPQNRSRP